MISRFTFAHSVFTNASCTVSSAPSPCFKSHGDRVMRQLHAVEHDGLTMLARLGRRAGKHMHIEGQKTNLQQRTFHVGLQKKLDSQAMNSVRLRFNSRPPPWNMSQSVLHHSPVSCRRQMAMPSCSATGVGLHPRIAWRYNLLLCWAFDDLTHPRPGVYAVLVFVAACTSPRASANRI